MSVRALLAITLLGFGVTVRTVASCVSTAVFPFYFGGFTDS